MQATRRGMTVGLLACLVAVAFGGPAQAGQFTEYRLGHNWYPDYGITLGPDGNVWFTIGSFTDGSGGVGRVTPSGEYTRFRMPKDQVAPRAITAGPDGNVWWSQYQCCGVGYVGKITPSGDITEWAIPGTGPESSDIITGPDGALWFTEEAQNEIGRITTDGVITEFQVPIFGSRPSGLAVGSDGNIWFTNHSNNTVGRMTPTGQVTTFTLPGDPTLSTNNIAAGPDGNLWVTISPSPFRGDSPETLASFIGRITTDGDITVFPLAQGHRAEWITPGPDGTMWFTEDHRLASITLDGTVITETGSHVGSMFGDITIGADGKAWFTDYGQGAIAIGTIG